MGITRSLRGVGIGHTEGEGSRLHELPEAVKFLELAIIRTHGGRREPDATLGCAYETTDRRERATVADGGNHLFGEDRPVGETVDTLGEVFQNARGDIVPAAHDNIGPERMLTLTREEIAGRVAELHRSTSFDDAPVALR